jgi:hypothetical protein
MNGRRITAVISAKVFWRLGQIRWMVRRIIRLFGWGRL